MNSGTRRRPPFAGIALLLALAVAALPAAGAVHDHPVGRDSDCLACEAAAARDAVLRDGGPALPGGRDTASLRLADHEPQTAPPVRGPHGARAPPA